MELETTPPGSRIIRPPRAISRKIAEPILWLADRMASADQEAVPRELRMVDALADAMGMATFRHQPWYRNMTEAGALRSLNSDLAKRAALVVLSLVLKADMKRRPQEQAYFSYLRQELGAEPITVPVDLEQHKKLALEYFRK